LSLESPTKNVPKKKTVKLVPPKHPRSPVKRKRDKKDFFTPSPSKNLKDAQSNDGANDGKSNDGTSNDGTSNDKKSRSKGTPSKSKTTTSPGSSVTSVTPSPKKDQSRPAVRSRKARKLDASAYLPPSSVIDVDLITSSSPPTPPTSQASQASSTNSSTNSFTNSTTSSEDVTPPTYSPLAIYKNISYTPRGDDTALSLSPPRLAALSLILERVAIPGDFETRKYGPLSGTSWEERVLTCYDGGMVGGDRTGKGEWICTECGEIGHRRKVCKTLI
ncbi:hypothetical protein TrRE_jg3022, partial [Triparma retinervis]